MHRSCSRFTILTILLAAGSCRVVPQPAGGGRGPTTTSISLAEAGLEADSIDRSADPCRDFYQFACGGWLAKTEIPADRSQWTRFSEIEQRNQVTLRRVLDDARAHTGVAAADPVTVKTGAFYDACMDEAAVEVQGLAGVQPLLDTIDKVHDPRSVAVAIHAVQAAGIPAGFGHGLQADFADPTTNALWIDFDGLGLPDRDYYLSAELADKRVAYRAHLVRMFGLLGHDAPASRAAADEVLGLETELAEHTKTLVERRDPASNYHPISIADLGALAPTLEWPSFLHAIGVDGLSRVNATDLDYFAALARLVSSRDPRSWRSYLTIRVIEALATTLPKRFDDEHFAIDHVLSGVIQLPERWRRCIDATGEAMPDAVSQLFVARAFPGESKHYADQLYRAIAQSIDRDLDSLSWLSAPTRMAAHAKLARIQFLTGYPDRWRSYPFAVAPATFTANSLAAATYDEHRRMAMAGKPVDRGEWRMAAYVVNAYYSAPANTTALTAGILQLPLFGIRRSIAANFGSIGMIAGHELTHGFDDGGAKFDATGRLADWWQPADLAAFNAKAGCVADQYSTFEGKPGKFVNGRLTLGENIADMGGIKSAFAAYRDRRARAAQIFLADGFTEDQQFFLGAAQVLCAKERDDAIERDLATNPHAPARFRITGPLRNLPAFAEAFQCAPGTPMHPRATCSVW